MTEAFIRNIEQFVQHEGIDLLSFAKRQRKDEVTQQYLWRFMSTSSGSWPSAGSPLLHAVGDGRLRTHRQPRG